MKLYYCSKGIGVIYNFSEDFLQNFIIKYEVVNKFTKTSYLARFYLYRRNKNKYVFTRYSNLEMWLLKYNLSYTIHSSSQDLPTSACIEFPFTLLDYQVPICNKIIYTLNTTNCCYFKLNTGLGKTYILCKVIEHFKVKTIVIGPNKNCKKTWLEAFRNLPPAAPVQYITINYALKCPEIFNDVFMVILDECHNIGTLRRYKVMWHINNKYVVGCTATPERLDNMHQFLPYFIGTLYDYDSPEEIVYNLMVNNIFYTSSVQPDIYDIENIHTAYKFITSDDKRNTVIADIISANPNNNIFVFSEYVSHLKSLADLIKTHNIIVYTHVTTDMDLQATMCSHKSNIVFTTYKMASESLSLQGFFIIIFATPRRSNMKQIIGRILRDTNADTPRTVYDIIDQNIGFFAHQHTYRQLYYTSKQYVTVNNFLKK